MISPVLGGKVTILIRPAGITLANGTTVSNRISGVVEDVVFGGEHYRIRLRCTGGECLDFYLPTPPVVGDELRIGFNCDAVQCLIDRNGDA